jgi:DMSO/TMAO reductase YedYZ molybdopterin-dependent catalytic subunit
VKAPAALHIGRRRFLIGAGMLLGMVALGAGALRRVLLSPGSEPVRADIASSIPDDTTFIPGAGLSPRITSRETHYVVDVNLDYPEVDVSTWRLRIKGAVANPLSLSLDDLRAMHTVEELATMACISNPVGGNLVGNSLWTGVPLARLLAEAGAGASARAVKGVGADGYEDNIPIGLAMAPTTLLAFGMDGATLPVAHGFPARLRIPPVYGMKNVKWLTDLVVLSEPEDGYWEKRGWDQEALVRTESRFDTPADGDRVGRKLTVAGIAWAGERRIPRVEVSADDGASWKPALLEAELGPLSWRRWQLALDLPPGCHALTVRAHDGAGAIQDSERRPPHPSGASGYHRIVVTAG